MFTTNIRSTALALTLGFGTLALMSSGHPAMAENVVSHTQSTVVAPAPSLLPATSTAPKAVQKQTKRSTTVNPDGTVETKAESSRTTYDAQGNLVTTTKSSSQSSEGVASPATTPAVVVREGNNLTISRGGDVADGNTKDISPSVTGYGAFRTGGRFNE